MLTETLEDAPEYARLRAATLSTLRRTQAGRDSGFLFHAHARGLRAIEKAQGPRLRRERCDACRRWTGVVCRLYPSEDAFHASPLYGGGDAVIDDPHAEFAVWPGKTNADRHPDDWWICTPVHPYCSDYWSPFSPPTREHGLHTDPFAGLEWEMAEDDRTQATESQYRQNRTANRIANRRAALGLEKSAARSVWQTCTCADPEPEDARAWTREYLRYTAALLDGGLA